jgi:hypothetical protein
VQFQPLNNCMQICQVCLCIENMLPDLNAPLSTKTSFTHTVMHLQHSNLILKLYIYIYIWSSIKRTFVIFLDFFINFVISFAQWLHKNSFLHRIHFPQQGKVELLLVKMSWAPFTPTSRVFL